MDAPPEQGLDKAMGAGELLGVFHIVADAGKAGEVFLDIVGRFALRNAQLVGQAETGNAIDDAEIDRLGAPAHFRRHVLRSEEHTSEFQSPYVISYAVFCLKKKKQ